MDGKSIQDRAAARARELPATILEHPFGPDWDVFKVRDRVFMLQTVLRGEPIVTLKADPEDANLLRTTHPDITAGYHMNKKHWITVNPGESVEETLVDDLVTESYLLVIEKNLPRRLWPVNPRTFGQGTTGE